MPTLTKNWKLKVAFSAFVLALGAFSAPRVFADGAADQSANTANQQCAPEPGWYLMLAAGALVPAGFYLKRRKEASELG
jgi:hypothetical protein